MPQRRTAGASKSSQVGRTSLGKAIEHDRRRKADIIVENRGLKATGVREGHAHRSVLEQSSLEEFMAQAEMSRATFEAARGQRFVESGPQLVAVMHDDDEAAGIARRAAAARAAARIVVPIPWRPQWVAGESAEELERREGESFLEWRRGLKKVEEKEGVVMTPYERNLDFWRQLWRCVERSDLLVQIVDSRDPLFYRSRDLERYVVTNFGSSKRVLLLMNKADFLAPELRKRWKAYFASLGVDVLFFSALRELHRQNRNPTCSNVSADDVAAHRTSLDINTRSVAGDDQGDDASEGVKEQEPQAPDSAPEGGSSSLLAAPHGNFNMDDDLDVLDCAQLLDELRSRWPSDAGKTGRRGVVGFVGYPNVGKSSVINALFGAKKVSMSRTPGKTKHLQTLELPETDITLCDCPGLVFPSVVATKHHLAINGTVPLVELQDYIHPVQLVLDKVGSDRIVEKYSLSEVSLREGAKRLGTEKADGAHRLLAALAVQLKHVLRMGVPDETWAAKRMLHDFCTGELLHCEEPPSENPSVPNTQAVSEELPGTNTASAPRDSASESDDFSDLDDFLRGEVSSSMNCRSKGRRDANRKAGERRRRESS